jgi:hypothetical protein
MLGNASRTVSEEGTCRVRNQLKGGFQCLLNTNGNVPTKTPPSWVQYRRLKELINPSNLAYTDWAASLILYMSGINLTQMTQRKFK